MAVNTQEKVPQDSSPLKKNQDTRFTPNFAAIFLDAILPYLGTRFMLMLIGLLANFFILPLVLSNAILPLQAAKFASLKPCG